MNNIIEKSYKDKSGSVAKNRLSYQTSFAIKQMVDFYPFDNYVVFLDMLEDISIKTIENGEEKIYFYQIKTKNRGTFTLSSILKENWVQALYKYSSTYKNFPHEINLVLNQVATDSKKRELFSNEKSNLEKDILVHKDKKGRISNNLDLIKKAICEKELIDINDVDLSNFYFIKTNFYIDTHKQQAQKILSDFIIRFDRNAEVVKVNAFVSELLSVLDDKFNYELSPTNTNYKEIEEKKGFAKTQFDNAIKVYLDENIPKASDLFKIVGITSIKEQKEIASKRKDFLIDLYNNEYSFKYFIESINKFLENADTRDFLDKGCEYIKANEKILPIYKDNNYVKFALLHTYKRYLDEGGVSNGKGDF